MIKEIKPPNIGPDRDKTLEEKAQRELGEIQDKFLAPYIERTKELIKKYE